MAYPTECQRLRLGGTVSGSTITGGTSIENLGINLADHSGVLSYAPRRRQNTTSAHFDGRRQSSRKPFDEAIMTLSFRVYGYDADGLITAPGGREEHMNGNLRTLFDLLYGSGLTAILERDVPDGAGGLETLWIEGEVVTGFPVRDGPVPYTKEASVMFKSSYPFWQSEVEHSEAIGAAETIVNAGRAPISNMRIVFPGDGELAYTNPPPGPHGAPSTDEIIEIVGSTGAVTVTPGGPYGGRAVYGNGSSAMGTIRRNRPYFMRFDAAHDGGDIDLAATGNPTVHWRDHYFT